MRLSKQADARGPRALNNSLEHSGIWYIARLERKQVQRGGADSEHLG